MQHHLTVVLKGGVYGRTETNETFSGEIRLSGSDKCKLGLRSEISRFECVRFLSRQHDLSHAARILWPDLYVRLTLDEFQGIRDGPSSSPNSRLVIDGNHLSSDVSTLRMIGAESRAASTDGCDQTSLYSSWPSLES